MRTMLTLALILTMAAAAMASDLGHLAPAKKPYIDVPYSPPAEVRQGGNTIAEAIPITIPGIWTGTTVGYTNNYDESCPWGGNAPNEYPYVLVSNLPLEVVRAESHSLTGVKSLFR